MQKTKLAIALSLIIGTSSTCFAILPGGCIVEGPATNNEICKDIVSDTDCAIAKKYKFQDLLDMSFETEYAIGGKHAEVVESAPEKIIAIDYINGITVGTDATYYWLTTTGKEWAGKTTTTAESDESGYISSKTEGKFQSDSANAITSFSTHASGATRGTHGVIEYTAEDGSILKASFNGGGSFSDNGIEARYSALYRIEGRDEDISVNYRIRNREVTGEYWIRNEGKRIRRILQYSADEPLFIADIDYIYSETNN